jgi:hypothetical protein
MDRKGGFGSLALVAVVAGALFRAPFGDRPSSQASATGGTGSSTADRPAAKPHADDDERFDTLDLLGESLGEDLSTEGLKSRGVRLTRTLGSGRGTNADWARAVAYLRGFFALRIRETAPGLKEAQEAAQALAGEYDPTSDRTAVHKTQHSEAILKVARFLDLYFNDDALHVEHPKDEQKLLAADFERVSKIPLKLEVLKQAALDQNVAVRFLIATLPDPIDSFTGWQFDPMLDAITQAVAASDYVLDRFHFPDGDDSEHDAGVAKGRAHEDEPSLVIFRRHIGGQNHSSSGERLVLLIVHENPSMGVHDRALADAIRLVARWSGDDRVHILGPTFSGSSDSIARVLGHVVPTIRSGAGMPTWIVSGSATDPTNKNTLENALNGKMAEGAPGSRIRFQATVQTDDRLLRALTQHVVQLRWSQKMAILYEGNTQYGRQLVELIKPNKQQISGYFSQIIELPFPMNISRLRTISQSVKPELVGALGLPSRFRPLSMEQPATPEDQIPQFSPKTTGSYLEIALSEMLLTLKREHVGTVALMATDPRDKLFLAQQIARDSPDVSIMTAENDSLYGHPDYASYLQGAIVASSYPLYTDNQRWSYGFQGMSKRRQFANGSSQGIYNAALVLLNYQEDGTPRPSESDEDRPPLLEYGSPAGSCAPDCQPPIWISVVGRGGTWPVRAYPAKSLDDDRQSKDAVSTTPGDRPAVFLVKAAATAGSAAGVDYPGPLTTPSPLFVVLCALLASVTFVGWVVVRNGPVMRIAGLPPIALDGDRLVKGRGYYLVCLLALFAIDAFIVALFVTRFRLERTLGSEAALAMMAVSLVALADLTRRVVVNPRPSGGAAPRRLGAKPFAMWPAVAIAFLAAWAIGNLLWYAWPAVIATPTEAIGFLTRAMNVGSGVCPSLPVLFLIAAMVLWSVVELKRLWTPAVALGEADTSTLINQTVTGGVEKMAARWAFFNRSIVAVPPTYACAIALTIAGVCLSVFDPLVEPLVTIEGPRFGRFVSTGLLVTQTLIGLSLAQFVYLWWSLKQLLDRMAWHPMAEIYQHVPPDLFPPSVFPRAPHLVTLHRAVARWQQHVSALSPMALLSGGTPVECLDLGSVFDGEMRNSPNAHWASSRTWQLLQKAIAQPARQPAFVGPAVAVPWTITPALLEAPDNTAPPSPIGVEPELIAMSMALVIRDAIARLGDNLMFITGGMLLVFCSYTLFPFQARQQLEMLGWAYIGLTFTAILTVLVQMKRNEIIGRMASGTSGVRSTWDAEFVLKIAIFGLLPLLALFTTQFPDVGGVILRWLEPVEKALP